MRQDVYDHVIADLFGEPPSIDTPLNAHNGFCRVCAAADAGERATAAAEYDRRRALQRGSGVRRRPFPPMARRVVAKQFLAELKKMDVPTTSNGVLSGSDVDCNAIKSSARPAQAAAQPEAAPRRRGIMARGPGALPPVDAARLGRARLRRVRGHAGAAQGAAAAARRRARRCPALGALLERPRRRRSGAARRRGTSPRRRRSTTRRRRSASWRPRRRPDASGRGTARPGSPPRTREADMPAFRLVPRFWLARWRAYHRLHGPRPGAFGARGGAARLGAALLDRLLRLAGPGAPDATAPRRRRRRRRGGDRGRAGG